MSIGNPKKFKIPKDVSKEIKETYTNSITRVHKDKSHKIKKELTFSSKKNASKLA